MIKGVNRRIIEVQETGSICFDKAIFFVKSEFSDQEQKVLEKEAKRIIKQYNICDIPHQNLTPAAKQKAGNRRSNIFFSVLSAFLGAFILYLIQCIF